MSREILKLVQEIDAETVDLQMALQCAPLLAGLKISNMFSIDAALYKQAIAILNETDISYYILRQTKEKIILLLYQEEQMQIYFSKPDIRAFLVSFGYTNFETEQLLAAFGERYCANIENGENFPHEMGIFLGYPLEDVEGFIKNKGKNFLYTGYWKVYEDMQKKVQIFQKFEHAKEFMVMLLSCGTGIKEIIDVFHYEELREAVI